MTISTRTERHENEEFLNLWEVKVKSEESQMAQDNSTELLGFPKFNI